MTITENRVVLAQRYVLDAALVILNEAAGRATLGDDESADALVVAVLRVLDGYEAIAQLSDVHEIAADPHAPVPFVPRARSDA